MNKPQPHQLTAWLLFLLILGLYATLVFRFPFGYVWATYEDLYGEWVQWYLFVAVLLLSGALALRRSPDRWFYLTLTLAALYTAGEEISWGQRLLGFGSPEFFEDYNIQSETNLHNFFTGPEHTWTNDLMKIVVAGGLIGFGVLYPWLLDRGWSPARWVRGLGVPAPPLYLWPFFPVAALFELGLFSFNEQEIAEILVGTAMMLMVARHGVSAAAKQGNVDATLDNAESRRLARRQGLLVAAVVVLALTTAQLNYHNPDRRAAIDQRVLNGYEKFGGRYESLGLWKRACDFYLKSYLPQPARRDLLENLVTCLQIGNDPRYRQYARLLLEQTLTHAQRGSRNVMQQIAVANSYRDIGEQTTADEHLRFALLLATAEATGAPGDPEAAYRLGLVYETLHDYARARTEYERARTLAPTDARYASGFGRADNYLKKAGKAVGLKP
jgi:tetratricopeptide (TPR) repeat protein